MSGTPATALQTISGASDTIGGISEPTPKDVKTNESVSEGWRGSPGPAEPSEQVLAFLQLFLYSCRLSGTHVSDGPMHVLNKYRVRFSAVLK